MSSLPQIFQFEAHEVRVVIKDGDPWWVLSEVCKVLKIVNSSDAASRLDDDEKSGVGIPDPHGRTQTTTVINESGLYSLILTSRKPEAKRFKKWVTSEVLPAIRKTGRYEVATAPAKDPRLVQVELLSSLIQQQIETEQRLNVIEASTASAIAKMELAITTVSGSTDFLSVLGYCKTRDISIPEPKMAQAGKAATLICKLEGIEHRQSHHERWGTVGIYPISVLDRVFASYSKGAA